MISSFLITTGLGAFVASFVLNILFNLIAASTGRRTGSFVSFGTVISVGLLFWVIAMVVFGLKSCGM